MAELRLRMQSVIDQLERMRAENVLIKRLLFRANPDAREYFASGPVRAARGTRERKCTMSLITLADYWMGRDKVYPMAMTPAIAHAALTTVGLANALLDQAQAAQVPLHRKADGSYVASGWRPPTVNASTPGAAMNSKHMTGLAIDVFDPDGDLDDWLMGPVGQKAMVTLGLWLEHPSATKGWAHVQTIPPRSGNRVFYP